MVESIAEKNLLYSSIGGDPDLGELVAMFVDEMAGRAAEFVRCAESNDWDGLGRLAHQMKGAAGSYGFEVVTVAAAKLEKSCRCDQPVETEIRQALDAMLDLCSRVRPGVGQ